MPVILTFGTIFLHDLQNYLMQMILLKFVWYSKFHESRCVFLISLGRCRQLLHNKQRPSVQLHWGCCVPVSLCGEGGSHQIWRGVICVRCLLKQAAIIIIQTKLFLANNLGTAKNPTYSCNTILGWCIAWVTRINLFCCWRAVSV